MSDYFATEVRGSTTSLCGFTIRSAVNAHGRIVDQAQYATEHYVVTTVAGATTVYAPGLNGRFVVDRAAGRLTKMDMSAQRPPVSRIRELLGEFEVVEDGGPVELDGRSCRIVRLHNRGARLVVSIETYCARVAGIELTALPRERLFDAPFQPFHVPIRDDEIVVRSTTRALAADFEQSQTLELTAVEPFVEGRDAFEEMLRYPVRGS